MKRNYPLFLIDRECKPQHPHHYITCLDRECGFVARIVVFKDSSLFNEFVEQRKLIENAEIGSLAMPLQRGGLALVVEDFLYQFEITNQIKTRIKSLFQKALKKYLHAALENEPDFKDLDIDNQIKQQELTIERARANFDELVRRSTPDEAKYNLALAEATLQTLRNYRDNQRFFELQLN